MKQLTNEEIAYFHDNKDLLQSKMAAGELCYLVEWWEQDEYWLNENSNLLFLFLDGEEINLVLHQAIWNELSSLLQQQGISWEYQYQNAFASNILFPPEYAGQPYYEKVNQSWWQRLFDWNEHWYRRADLPPVKDLPKL